MVARLGQRTSMLKVTIEGRIAAADHPCNGVRILEGVVVAHDGSSGEYRLRSM
jgi:hypothetical protein